MAYRHFVCDGIRIITENTAKAVPGGNGGYLAVRFFDLLSKPNNAREERTAEEIISDIRKKMQ